MKFWNGELDLLRGQEGQQVFGPAWPLIWNVVRGIWEFLVLEHEDEVSLKPDLGSLVL